MKLIVDLLGWTAALAFLLIYPMLILKDIFY